MERHAIGRRPDLVARSDFAHSSLHLRAMLHLIERMLLSLNRLSRVRLTLPRSNKFVSIDISYASKPAHLFGAMILGIASSSVSLPLMQTGEDFAKEEAAEQWRALALRRGHMQIRAV